VLGTAVEGGAAVTTVRPVELAPDADVARRSVAERSKLRRELGRLDAVCLLIAAIVVLDTLGAVARGGAQTLTWLAVVAALFFVPAGLVIAELGAAFPNQGGPYKRNPALVGDQPALLADMPHLCGVDDIRASRDLLGQAERLAARAWRADRTWFSVSGSTMVNPAMCLAVAAPGDRVVVARTSHRSVLASPPASCSRPSCWTPSGTRPTPAAAWPAPPTRRWRRCWSSGPEGRDRVRVGDCHSGRLRWPRITPRQPSSYPDHRSTLRGGACHVPSG
jgi:hypothetical protein